MSLTVTRSEGVTMLTLTSDSSSPCPPLCQLLCCCPGLCSKSKRLTFQRAGAQSALGALWILTGLLHIGLGVRLISTSHGPGMYQLRHTKRPVWLGALFVVFGVCCILAERYPRPIIVLLSGLLNLTGAALSIAAIVFYSIAIPGPGFYSSCGRDYDNYYWGRPRTTTTVSPEKSALRERCEEARYLQMVLTISVSAALITLSVLDLCLGISSAVLSFKSLKQGLSKSESKPLLEEAEDTNKE